MHKRQVSAWRHVSLGGHWTPSSERCGLVTDTSYKLPEAKRITVHP